MRCLIDTNIIIDVLAQRQPFFRDSERVLTAAYMARIDGLITPGTFSDIAYILRHDLSPAELRPKLLGLLDIVRIASLDNTHLALALQSNLPDIEDSIQIYSAAYMKADYVVTRNQEHFIDSPVPAILPEDLLKLLGVPAAS